MPFENKTIVCFDRSSGESWWLKVCEQNAYYAVLYNNKDAIIADTKKL